MSFFTSQRERRLWLWTAAVMVAIYATLGVARPLAGILRDRGLIDAAFSLGLLLVVGTIVLLGLKVRPGGAEIGVALGIAAVYFIVSARMAIPEERSHLIEYSVVALLIHEAFKERLQNGRYVPAPALLALTATILLGWLDEGIQLLLPNRHYNLVDVGFNALAAVMAIGGSVALAWVRRRVAKLI